jgi:hypothetical protein
LDRLARERERVQDLLGVRPERPARRRRRQAALPALEEASAERRLEGLDPRAHRGLRDAERRRSPTKSAECADGEERFDLIDVHLIRIGDRADKRNQGCVK